jgi:uncharacterized protein YprB with RNaseH-like and TPR domain
MVGPRTVVLDLESSSLEADAGIIVGAGLMSLAGRTEYFEARKTSQEKTLLLSLLERLEKYDIIVTWAGNGFDIPFLTTRLLKHGLDPRVFLSKNLLDLNEVVKRNLRLTFTYLDHVCDFFDIERKDLLTGLDVPFLYVKAMEGDRFALKRIRQHCLDDLRVTREIFLKLKPLLRRELLDESERGSDREKQC